MPLPGTISCFSEIQIGFTFLVPAHAGNPGQNPQGRKTDVCVCVYQWRLLSREDKAVDDEGRRSLSEHAASH